MFHRFYWTILFKTFIVYVIAALIINISKMVEVFIFMLCTIIASDSFSLHR